MLLLLLLKTITIVLKIENEWKREYYAGFFLFLFCIYKLDTFF